MAKLTYFELPKSVTGYDQSELIDLFGTADDPKMPKTVLFRTIIMNQLQFPTATETRSLRGFWYDPIKPILSMLGYLKKRNDSDDPGRRMSQDLSGSLGDMVKGGVLKYIDLQIVDNSRQLNSPDETDCESKPGMSISGYAERGKIYPHVILAIEKDTEYDTVRGVADILGCSVISGSGHSALSAMEKLLLSCKDEIGDQDLRLRTLTDYDPDGYSIADDFVDHASIIMGALDMPGKVGYRRLGIFPGQIEADRLDSSKFEIVASKKKQQQLADWIETTGGINDEAYGLELDALPRSQIRELFVTGCEDLIDLGEIITEDNRRDYIAGIVSDAIQDRVLKINDQIFAKYADSITGTGIDLFDLARYGRGSFLSSDLFTTDRQTEIVEEAMRLASVPE